MSVQVSYKKQFVFGIILILIIMAAVEGVIRINDQINPDCHLLGSDVFDNIDYFLERQTCNDFRFTVHHFKPIKEPDPNQHFPTLNINSFGFRGEEITKEKPEDVFRIFVLGGSTIFGAGATSDETTIPGFLEKKLQNEDLGKKIQVVNAGVGSWTSGQETYQIKNKILDFEPDFIIVYDGWNDAIGWANFGKSLSVRNDNTTIFEDVIHEISRNYYYRTPLVLSEFWAENIAEPPKDVILNENEISEVVSNWNGRWNEICELGEQEGFTTLITVQPILGTGKKMLTEDESRFMPKTEKEFQTVDILNRFANSLDQSTFTCENTADLRETFSNIVEPVYYDPVHMSDFGNEIVAQRLFEISLPLILENTS